MRIHCPQCHNILGEVIAGHWIMCHKGREAIGPLDVFVSIRCERCGRKWTAQAGLDWHGIMATERSQKKSPGGVPAPQGAAKSG